MKEGTEVPLSRMFRNVEMRWGTRSNASEIREAQGKKDFIYEADRQAKKAAASMRL